MISIKTKIKLRMAVKDYFEMFPEDWEYCKRDIEYQRQNLMNDFASIPTHAIKRGLFVVPEKLSSMISMKLDESERQEFTEKENARWFAKEFPQFALTKKL